MLTAGSASIFWLSGTGCVLILGGLLVPRVQAWTLAVGLFAALCGFALICVATAIYFRS
jgi:hypothetical protein